MVVGLAVHIQYLVYQAVNRNSKDKINKDRSNFQTVCLHIETDICLSGVEYKPKLNYS